MADITELEANLAKMQQLLKSAQNEVQKKTFQDIIDNLTKQLESEKSKLNPTKVEEIEIDKPLEKEATNLPIQPLKAQTPKPKESQPKSKSESQIEAKASSEAPPLLEVKSEEKVENQEDESLPPKQNYAFQGLGVLYGKIVKRYEDNDNYYNAIIKDKTYELIIINPRVKDFLKADYNPEKDRYLTVYPNLVHYPQPKGGTKPPKINFTIIAANDTLQLDLKVNEFKLFGLWQFIGVCKCPVISIHRNRSKGDRVSQLKQKFENEKLNEKLTRANHVPLLWRDAPVKPFRFNPKLDKDKQGDRYFVQVKARFLADKGVWGFMELIGEPTLDVPKFYKPLKAAPPSQDEGKQKHGKKSVVVMQ